MKKLFFVMACVIGMMTFTSCDPSAIDDLMKQKPEISLLQGEDLFTHNTGVRVGTELNFQVKVAPNSSSMSPIANVKFTVKDLNGNLLKSESPEFEDPSVENIFDFSFTAEDSETTYVFTFTVTDQASKSNEIIVNVISSEVVEPINGIYSGLINLHGYITTNEIAGHETYNHEEKELNDIPVTIYFGETNEQGQAHIGIEVEDTYMSFWCPMESNTIDLNEFVYYQSVELFVNVVVAVTANIDCEVEDGVMTLSGTAEGIGEATVLLAKLDVKLEEGTLEGTLVEVTE